MKKMSLGMVLLASATLFAQSPFDGTWMTKLDTAKLPSKADKYSLRNNMYECLTCVPKVAVKADGTDQKVTGHPYYDTVAVHVVNASSVEIIEKKDGKVMYTDNETLSADGNTLNDTFTDKTGTQPVTGEATSKRVSAGPAGSHALSGAWRTEKINSVSTSLLRAGLVRTRRRSIDQSWGDGADLAAGDRPGAIDLTGTILGASITPQLP